MAGEEHLLTPGYALGILDDAELAQARAHLAGCDTCRTELPGFDRTAALLGAAQAVAQAVEPPPGLRAAVLAEVARTPQDPASSLPLAATRAPAAGLPRQRSGSPRFRPVTALVAALTVAVLAVAAVAGGYGLQEHRRAVTAERQVRDLRDAVSQARTEGGQIAEVAAQPGVRLAQAAMSGGGRSVLLRAGAQAVLLTDAAPALPAGRVYQLWRVAPGDIRSAGLGPGGPAAQGRWSRLLTGLRPADSVALSVEPAGGSSQPTTTPIVVLTV